MGAMAANIVACSLCVGADITLSFWLRDCLEQQLGGLTILITIALLACVVLTGALMSGAIGFYDEEDFQEEGEDE